VFGSDQAALSMLEVPSYLGGYCSSWIRKKSPNRAERVLGVSMIQEKVWSMRDDCRGEEEEEGMS